MSYQAPIKDIQHAFRVVGAQGLAALPAYQKAGLDDLLDTIIEEAGKFAADILAPLNHTGDLQGVRLTAEGVKTADGWRDAYRQFADNGWGSLAFDHQYGGQGLPVVVSAALMEFWNAANMAFGLCPLLTQGAIDSIATHGSEAQKNLYLPKMIAGQWTGTMNLTESQAGTDLAAIRTMATPNGDHYLLKGQKIFITYGDHDLTENIIHMVLARTPDAPPGVKGISLFIVPKFLVNADGSLGARNDVHCVSLERKLGIHASPTAVMSYGDQQGAVGYLVGEKNQGLMYMFTMMNIARHNVGVQGYAVADRAYQQARYYAMERVQGHALLASASRRSTIINHPDIRRTLTLMRTQIQAMRLVALECAMAFDYAKHHPDDERRQFYRRRSELLTPLVKGWSTEVGVEICSLGLQIHGGMGFIEETGAAQHLRDVRITTIYEGTTAIQANDLIGRKLKRDRGLGVTELIVDIKACREDLPSELVASLAQGLNVSIDAVESTTDWMLSQDDPALPAAASVSYLLLLGIATGAWMMARSAIVACEQLEQDGADTDYLSAHCTTARFYAQQIVPSAKALASCILQGSESAISLRESQF